MLDTASFAPPPNPVSLNDRLESGLRVWVTAARAELNRTVPSTDVIRNVMNQGMHLYAVSARLLEVAECEGALACSTAAAARESLHTATEEMGKADRLWGSVTTAMQPSHEYVTAARELHAVLTGVTHDGLRPREIKEIAKALDFERALADLRYAVRDVADLVRDIQQRGFPLRYSLIIGARAARGAPRPGWVGFGAHRALAAELAGFARPCAATCRSRARRRRPGAGVCGTAVRGCEHSCG